MALMTKRSQATTPNNAPNPDQRSTQTFTQHIRELRRRLFWSVLVGFAVSTVVYMYHDFFVKLIMAPLGQQKLVYLTPIGGFSFIFMVTFYVTMIISLPFFLYQLYAFIRPAIPRHTSRLSFKVAVAAILLMAAGATFGYLYAVPGGLRFLHDFASSYVTPTITADSYLNFVLGYVLGLGVIFELPLLLLFWHWIKPLTPKGLMNSERYVIVGAFVVAAIISPSPDVTSQTIIAIPIIIIYQFGVIAALLSIRKSRKQQKKTAITAKTLENQPFSQVVAATWSAPTAAPAALSTPPKPLNKRPPTTLDGVRPVTIKRQPHHKAPVPMAPIISRTSKPLIVPKRHLINDFAPIRRSAVDMAR